jgi:tetratricopeptide (TPR) repeat protein/DNA-binding winged helix-turn-helix (wHTH) protein
MAVLDKSQMSNHSELAAEISRLPGLGTSSRAPSNKRVAERRFEQGLYAYHRGDYSQALKDFEKSCDAAMVCRDFPRYVEACTYVLRILAEREEFAKIDRLEQRILKLLASADSSELSPRLKSRALYVLGICSCYQESRHDQAMRRFREAIDFAMLGDDKEALAAPLYGAATAMYASQRFSEALRELDRLGVLLSCLKVPDITSASHLLRAMVLRNQGVLDEALASAWKSFESLKHHPHLVLYLHTLCVLGTIYLKKGDPSSARLYLELADRGLKRDEFPRVARLVDEAIAALGCNGLTDFDLTFDARTGLLIEKSKGEVRFEGQFILRDLLRVFLENPGVVFTKEDLVRRVWREAYNPKIHDNKIYVTIKRLRQLLETSDGKSDYILRAKNGYFLNPKTRVCINDQPFGTSEKTK